MLDSPPSQAQSISYLSSWSQKQSYESHSSYSAKSYYGTAYLGQISNELISHLLNFRALVDRLHHRLLLVIKWLHFEFGILNMISPTFSRLKSTTRSAIIRLSKGSRVFCETLKIVAPKGWRFIPSDLKFSMRRKMATMRCWLLRSWISIKYIMIEQVAYGKGCIEDGKTLIEDSQKLILNLIECLVLHAQDVQQLLNLLRLNHL